MTDHRTAAFRKRRNKLVREFRLANDARDAALRAHKQLVKDKAPAALLAVAWQAVLYAKIVSQALGDAIADMLDRRVP